MLEATALLEKNMAYYHIQKNIKNYTDLYNNWWMDHLLFTLNNKLGPFLLGMAVFIILVCINSIRK